MPSAEDAIALKQKGNKAVAAHEWLNAIDFYSQAIELNDKDATFFCNRSQVITPSTSLVCDLLN